MNSGLTNPEINCLIVNGIYIFSGTTDGVFVSTDNALNWTEVSSGLTYTYILSMTSTEQNIFAGTDGGVFISTNYGSSWTEANFGLTNLDIWSLFYDGIKIYAGNWYGGLFASTNNGTNWYNYSTGLPDIGVSSYAVKDSNIFIGLRGKGVWKRPLSDIINAIDETEKFVNSEFILEQNYPNPFNPVTKIKYTIPQDIRGEKQEIILKVYDVLGREVATLVNEEKPAGKYEVEFNGSSLTSGIYFYQLLVSALRSKDGKAGPYSETRKMVLIK